MIKYTDDIIQIANIWMEAFGDSFEDVEYFANKLKNGKCIGYFINEKLVSMFYLIDCNLDEKENYYVYAACTLKEYRGQGCMSALLDFVKEKYNKVCLIPANESLIEYYKNNGLTCFSKIENLHFYECDDLINEYLFEGCSLKTPIVQCYKGE